jgi:MoaA/NifB/PqqE/SkfB family radical SAM enzyme
MNNYIDSNRKILEHVDRIGQIKTGGRPAPINVEIDLSNRCNLGCSRCPFAYTHTRGYWSNKDGSIDTGDLIETDLAEIILDDLRTNGVRSVVFTGGGEPTLHPDFDRIIDYNRIPAGIYTNGTNITPERAAIMKQSLEWCYVSLNRHTAEEYAEYTHSNVFDKAVNGIHNLVNADGNATIGVGFLLSENNYMDVACMIELGHQLKADYIQFRPEIAYDMENPQQATGDLFWIDSLLAMDDWKNMPDVVIDADRFQMYRDWQGHTYPRCYWTQLQTVITPNGKVWNCLNRRGFKGDELGDLSTERFANVWARSGSKAVDCNCRVMCRGSISNLALDTMMTKPQGHDLFV